MKKVICAFLTMLMLVSVFTFSVAATDSAAPIVSSDNQVIEYYADGSYSITTVFESLTTSAAKTTTKSGVKNYRFYDSDGNLLWTVTLNGTFTYTGSSATCTNSSVSSSIQNSSWKVTSAVASRSGATAIGDFVVKRYTLLIPVQTVNKHLTLTCSATGTLS